MKKKALPTPPFYKPYKLKSLLNKIHLIKKKEQGWWDCSVSRGATRADNLTLMPETSNTERKKLTPKDLTHLHTINKEKYSSSKEDIQWPKAF